MSIFPLIAFTQCLFQTTKCVHGIDPLSRLVATNVPPLLRISGDIYRANQDGRDHAPGGQFLSSDTRLLFIASLLSVWFLDNRRGYADIHRLIDTAAISYAKTGFLILYAL